MIVGIDEVGRGAWAGPLVVGAVVLGGRQIAGLCDSKKLTRVKRELLDKQIREQALAWGLGWVDNKELDQCGLAEALRLATRRALEAIPLIFNEIIIDGTVNFLKDTPFSKQVTLLKKADDLIPSVSAASILAKVARDNYMIEQAFLYPSFDFKHNVGYGTAKHQKALAQYGATTLHRQSFQPVKKIQTPLLSGCVAEKIVADYFLKQGYKILERNWFFPGGEIDVIIQKNQAVYFVEVKHRQKSFLSDGLDAITDQKLKRMRRAVEFYFQTKPQLSWDKVQLVVVATTGNPIRVQSVVFLD